MQDVFLEESVTKTGKNKDKFLHNLFKILSIVFFGISLLWFIIFFNFFNFAEGQLVYSIITLVVPSLLFFASGLIFVFVKNKFNVDYDYTFINGSITFSKVINSAKRIDILSFDTTNIEKIGPINTNSYNKYNLYQDISKKILTENSVADADKGFYYIVVNKNSKKYIFTLECTLEFIRAVIKFSNKLVVDEDFK